MFGARHSKRRNRGRKSVRLSEQWRTSSAVRILLFALITLLYLAVCRSVIIYHESLLANADASWSPGALAPKFGMDALAVACLALAAVMMAPISRVGAVVVFVTGAACLMLLGAINVRIVSVYQQPATLNLFRYGNFLNIGGLRSLSHYLTKSDQLLLLAAFPAILSFALVPAVQRSRLFAKAAVRWLVGGLVLLTIFLLPVAGALASAEVRTRHANAGWWLARSVAAAPFTATSAVSDPDFADPFQTYVPGSDRPITTPDRMRAAEIRNVVLIVLESVGTQYLEERMAAGRAPNLRRMISSGAYFPNAYAPMPSSPVALFALMTGMYPPVSPVAIPMGDPEFPAPTLTERLRSAGKRSGVFSANWGFMDFAGYLKERGVDHLEETAESGNCQFDDRRKREAEDCTFAGMSRWIGQSNRPFFALLWTSGTHFPYGASPSQAIDPEIARKDYLAAIGRTDRLVGELVRSLDRKGMLDQTLLVVVGDHGESFAQHGNRAHGNDVYREAIRVPLIFSNPRLFSGVADPSPVRLIDVPPTILSLTDQATPPTMQGLDLSKPLRPQRVFFSAAWLNLVMGFEERGMKYHYAFVTDRLEAFDLRRDPGERFDRSRDLDSSQRVRIVRRILNWKAVVDSKLEAARSAGLDVSATSQAAAGSSGSRRCCRRF